MSGQPELHAKRAETSIPALEEVPKWLAMPLPAQGNRDEHLCSPSPHMPSRSHLGVITPHCTPSRCYCGAAASPNISTTPKVASVVNIPSHARSGEGMAWASLDEDDAGEDDFQTPHTLVCHVTWWEDDGSRCLAERRPESSRGCPGQQIEYQVDIGEEEHMLEMVDPTWRTTRQLHLVVQGILDDEVPWYELIIPLMVGTEGVALSLAKCLLAIWRWSIKVQGQDICPPALMALNIGQFMTREELLENVDDSLWFAAYSHTLQRVGEAARG